jgi:hypothetical protein
MRYLLATALLPLTLAAQICSAGAEEYCVTCTEPDTKYRCIVTGAAPDGHAQRGQLLCITEIAKVGEHASCSVGAVNAGPCPGNLRTVTVTAETPLPPAAPVEAAAPAEPPAETATAPSPGPAPAPPAEEPPKTVEELAKKTVQSSGEGIKQAGKAVTDTAQSAGNAVGNAMKKTWNCVSSFFGDC